MWLAPVTLNKFSGQLSRKNRSQTVKKAGQQNKRLAVQDRNQKDKKSAFCLFFLDFQQFTNTGSCQKQITRIQGNLLLR